MAAEKDVITPEILKERDDYLAKFDKLSGRALWDACEKDPAVFAWKMLGIKLYAWQWVVTRGIVSGNRRVIMNTSRQIGKSFLTSILSLWYAYFNKGHSSDYVNTKIGIISGTDDQAKKLILDIKNLMRVGDVYCREHYSRQPKDVFDAGIFTSLIDNSQGAENNRSSITFMPYHEKFGVFLKGSKVGSFIKSLPPTDIVRGNTFDLLIVDEASLIDDETYNSAISKTGDKFDALRIICSTPRGSNGFFFEYFDPYDKLPEHSWKRYWFSIECIQYDDAADYNRRVKDIKEQNQMGKNLVVRQEYYGEFVQSEQSFFNPDKVDAMIDDSCSVTSYRGECDCGIDFGGLRKSRTVITICYYSEGIIHRIYHQFYAVRQDSAIIEDLKELKTRFNIQRFIIDYCPESDYKSREMEQLGWEITKMQFVKDRTRKYGDLRSMLNKGLVKSYNDPDLVGEMKAMVVTQGRDRSIIAPPIGYSDDFVDSFILATYHMTGEADTFNFYDLDEVKK